MLERRQTIETGFDGTRWYNMLVGGYVVANFRATLAEAEFQGRAMAQARRAAHVVRNEDGEIVSHVDYGPDGARRARGPHESDLWG